MIKIDENIKHLVPKEFLNLEDVNYRLTKTQNFRLGMANDGDSVEGPLTIVEVKSLGLPGVKVINTSANRFFDNQYIRTSPIVKVLDAGENSITFETQGGVYLLEKVVEIKWC